MNITKDDVINHLKNSFNMRGEEKYESRINAWRRAEIAEETYFESTADASSPRDKTLSNMGVTWNFIQITRRMRDGESDFTKVTKFTLPSGEEFYVGASFSSDSWDAGSNYYVTSESISEVHPRERVVQYFE